MSWTSFHCEDPDFTVHSVPDDVSFGVKRSALQNSQVFCDMFACCDQANISVDVDISQTLGLAEPTQVIIVLLRLLHDPPGPPLEMPDDAPDFSSSRLYQKRYDRSTVIPLPLITTTVFELLDKYILNSSIVDAVWLHVAAHAPTDPLQVYGFATLHGKEKIASWASQYVMPLASYRADEIKVIPTVEAYHKLVRLEALRLKSLKTMLLSEDIFPHGYGKCSVHHDRATSLWDAQRKALAGRADIGTDVAAEMSMVLDEFLNCEQCHKAFNAAIGMLSYKSRRVPRRIDQLPSEG
ncbi:hypothetical protein AX14_007786 [Amanita brunnescens Koide BX004]|nr:hypothetical protein AX14_007786 [Amanita brunnescens Koide BX004]